MEASLQHRVEEEEAAKTAMPVEDYGDKAREELLALWTEGHIDEAEFLRRSTTLEEQLAKEQVATTGAIDLDNDVTVGGEVSATAVDSDKVGCESDAKDKVDSPNEKTRERSATVELKVPAKSKATKLPKEEAKAIAKNVLQERDQHGADAVAQPKSEKVRFAFLSSCCRLTLGSVIVARRRFGRYFVRLSTNWGNARSVRRRTRRVIGLDKRAKVSSESLRRSKMGAEVRPRR